MALSAQQRGVLKGAGAAALLAVGSLAAAVAAPLSLLAHDAGLAARLAVVFSSAVFVLVPLAVSIGRLARLRFFSAQDIDGSALTTATPRAALLQSIVQNTLEQTVLALGAHFVWAACMPPAWLGAVPVAAALFVAGRIAFAVSYANGAAARAFGFGLTFYPTLIMLVSVLVYVIVSALS